MKKKNNQQVIDNFIETFGTVKEGIEFLNDRLGTAYKHNSISNWRTEKERPGVRCYELMVKRILSEHGHDEIYELIKLDMES